MAQAREYERDYNRDQENTHHDHHSRDRSPTRRHPIIIDHSRDVTGLVSPERITNLASRLLPHLLERSPRPAKVVLNFGHLSVDTDPSSFESHGSTSRGGPVLENYIFYNAPGSTMSLGSGTSSCTGCFTISDGEQSYRGERYVPVTSGSVLGRRGDRVRGEPVVVGESSGLGHGHCKACDRDRDRDRRRYGYMSGERFVSPHYYTVTGEGEDRGHVHSGRAARPYSYGAGGQTRYGRAYYGRAAGSDLEGVYYVH